MVKDAVFGPIEWGESAWDTTTSLPYFRVSGEKVHMPDEERDKLPPADRLPLKIETGGVRKKPSKAQQAAWRTILGRGDAVWDEAMDAAITEYQRQRPKRARYWQVVNDPEMLSQSLPANADRSTMRQLLAPVWCKVHPEDEEHSSVDCLIAFLASWWSEGVNIYMRDGHATSVAPVGATNYMKLPWIDAGPFGKLRRRKRTPWYGTVELEPFTSFGAVAVDRSTWDEGYGRSDPATSDLPWEVARGSSQLSIYSPPNAKPSPGQVAAFEEFLKGRDNYTATVVDALIELYKRLLPARRPLYTGKNPEAAFPPVNDESGLREVTELQELFVFPDAGGPVAIGFNFRGPWTGNDGVGVRWRDGRLEAVGHPNVADPDRFERDEAKLPLK